MMIYWLIYWLILEKLINNKVNSTTQLKELFVRVLYIGYTAFAGQISISLIL